MKKVNVLGFGIMGTQISALLQLLGYNVTVFGRQAWAEQKLHYERDLKLLRRGFTPNETIVDIRYVNEIGTLEPVMTIETLAEDLAIKKAVLGRLPFDVGKVDFFTNTSSYSPSEIHPSAHGLHFFNPIFALHFAEVTCDTSILSESGRAFLDKLRSAGFELVKTGGNRGYIGNTILFQEIASAFKLVDNYGYKSRDIDSVLLRMGHVASLFDIVDLVGIDVTKAILLNLKEVDPSINVSPLLSRAIDRGILGKKNKTTIRALIDES